MKNLNLLFAATLLLAGCAGPGAPRPETPQALGALGETVTLTGLLTGATAQETKLGLLLQNRSLTRAPTEFVPAGVVHDDGTFRLDLPGADVMTPYLNSLSEAKLDRTDCSTFTLNYEPDDFKLKTAFGLATKTADSTALLDRFYYGMLSGTSRTTELPRDTQILNFTFVDRDVRVTGETLCTYTTDTRTYQGRFTYDETLRKGWNAVTRTTRETDATVDVTVRTTTLPTQTNLAWTADGSWTVH
ncbi:hypothetical protein [Deinococcus pimensis]|uniref:hypothetical protein n=1 Tax=Deinococcus pimensis TaxID=309888 RepID=UPI0012FA4873|nr:hypothetical protein [Deinococcus pimensis]